jgi:type VI secretion system secreted protein VgrG
MQSIELKVGSNSIKIDQSGITIKGIMVKIEASALLEAKASAMGTVDGGGMLTVKGGLVMIN